MNNLHACRCRHPHTRRKIPSSSLETFLFRDPQRFLPFFVLSRVTRQSHLRPIQFTSPDGGSLAVVWGKDQMVNGLNGLACAKWQRSSHCTPCRLSWHSAPPCSHCLAFQLPAEDTQLRTHTHTHTTVYLLIIQPEAWLVFHPHIFLFFTPSLAFQEAVASFFIGHVVGRDDWNSHTGGHIDRPMLSAHLPPSSCRSVVYFLVTRLGSASPHVRFYFIVINTLWFSSFCFTYRQSGVRKKMIIGLTVLSRLCWVTGPEFGIWIKAETVSLGLQEKVSLWVIATL